MQEWIPVPVGKGVNRDAPPWELELGYWSSVANMRFRNGLDERVGGLAAVFTTPSVAPYALETYDVSTASSGATKRYLFQQGLAKSYVDDGTTQTEVTRYTEFAITAISGAAGTVTVTTNGNHGMSTGNTATIHDVIPVGYNADGVTVTVTGVNTFTYANATTAAVTRYGVVSRHVQQDFTAAAGDEITTCVMNGVLYVNTRKEGLYYWAGNTSRRLRRLSYGNNAVNNWVYARAVRAFKDYLILLGFDDPSTNSATSAALTLQPYNLGFSSSADPGATPTHFVAASTNDAGKVQKTRGAFVDGRAFGETFYAYQERGIVSLEYIGGNDVFSFRYLEGSDGLLAPNCICNTPAGQFFFSQNFDLKVHTGGPATSVADGVMLNWIRNNIESTYYARSFLVAHHRFKEVWLCIPTTGSSTCNKALIYNYEAKTWGERSLTDVTCAIAGMLPTSIAVNERLVIGTTTPRLGLADSGTTDFGSSYTSSCERTGIHLDQPGTKKLVDKSRLFADMANATTVSVYHGAHKRQETTASYSSAATYTHNTTRDINKYAPGAAEYIAFKVETTASEYRLRKYEINVHTYGSF